MNGDDQPRKLSRYWRAASGRSAKISAAKIFDKRCPGRQDEKKIIDWQEKGWKGGREDWCSSSASFLRKTETNKRNRNTHVLEFIVQLRRWWGSSARLPSRLHLVPFDCFTPAGGGARDCCRVKEREEERDEIARQLQCRDRIIARREEREKPPTAIFCAVLMTFCYIYYDSAAIYIYWPQYTWKIYIMRVSILYKGLKNYCQFYNVTLMHRKIWREQHRNLLLAISGHKEREREFWMIYSGKKRFGSKFFHEKINIAASFFFEENKFKFRGVHKKRHW